MKNHAKWVSTVATIVGSLIALPTYAQISPIPPGADPAAISKGLVDQQRDQAPLERLPDQPPVTVDRQSPVEPDGPETGPTFELKGITFDSSAFLSSAALEAVTAPRIGTRVSIKDLRAIAAEVNALYTARGILTARAYVPPQKIEGGVARIALVEGRLGTLNIAESQYTSSKFVRSRITISPNAVVDLSRLRRQINVFNRTNDMRIQAQLQPGAQVGLTDILISIAEPSRTGLQLFVDTYGYESTGRYQAGISLRRNALLFGSDRVNLYGSLSDGGLVGNIGYSVVAGSGRIGLNYSRSQITVTQGPSASLDIKGFADTGSFNYAHALLEKDTWHATFLASASYTASENLLSGQSVGQSKVYKATSGVAVGSGAGTDMSANLNLTASVARAKDSLEPGGTTIPIFNADLSFLARLSNTLSLRVVASGQHAEATFVPSNQLFQLGGPASIRGFEPGSASGSSGYYTQTELNLMFPKISNTNVFAFLDHGKAFSADFGDRALSSVGAGLRVPIWRFYIETAVGFPITKRRENDGSYRADAKLSLMF